MRLYIIRHADPDYAIDSITPEGHKEAAALAKRMQAERLDRIYSSPLGRAQATMKYTAEAIGIEPATLPWTAELSGWNVTDEGGVRHVIWDLDGATVRRRQPVPAVENWYEHPPYDNPDFVERYAQLKGDSDAFLSSLGYEREGGVYRIIEPNRKRVAVFCHMGFGLAWLAHLLELPLPLVWAGFWLAPSSVTTILFDERTPETAVPRCIGLGDVAHLYEAGLPARPRGIIANFD